MCCFLETDEIQTSEGAVDDDAVGDYITRKIEILESTLQTWRNKRNRLTQ